MKAENLQLKSSQKELILKALTLGREITPSTDLIQIDPKKFYKNTPEQILEKLINKEEKIEALEKGNK